MLPSSDSSEVAIPAQTQMLLLVDVAQPLTESGKVIAPRMARRSKKFSKSEAALFADAAHAVIPRPRKHGSLFIQRFVEDEAKKQAYAGHDQDRAYQIICKWADLESQGHLPTFSETSVDLTFLNEVFGEGLGYTTKTNNASDYQLDGKWSVPGGGQADGVLGKFPTESTPEAVIELKDAQVDLDREKSNGRTAVQQCFDYLIALPECPWGIVSNMSTIRLYHRSRTQRNYEEFTLQELRKRETFNKFYFLFHRGALLGRIGKRLTPLLELLKQTEERHRTVGDDLYNNYRLRRNELIHYLTLELKKPLDVAIRWAQRLLDRVIFIAFCEQRGLLRARSLKKVLEDPGFTRATNPHWQSILALFDHVDQGHPSIDLQVGFNGGLFRREPGLDDLQLPDEPWVNAFTGFGEYDFREGGDINVDVLGHLFEKSITELEKLRPGGLLAIETAPTSPSGRGDGGEGRMPKSAERKKFGIYYTPPTFTGLIVDKTVDVLIRERLESLAGKFKVDPDTGKNKAGEPSLDYWNACLDMLKDFKICDPACGSGAFLIRAYDSMRHHYDFVIDGLIAASKFRNGTKGQLLQETIPDLILTHNLHGVDVSEQAVEITQLALWIRSARPNRKLTDISENIVCRNSLVFDKAVHERAINWEETFPQVFDRNLPLPPGEGRGEGVADSKPPLDPKLRDFARTLRSTQTDAEGLMWALLRGRRFGGFKFRRQHPVEPYVLDFYCDEAKLAVELDGGQHNAPDVRRKDEQRTAFLAQQGIGVLRFWDHDVLADTQSVLEAIWNAVHPLTPNPSPKGRGGLVHSAPKGRGGFDCVIGNPPWERVKLQEREFFSLTDPETAESVSAADRRKRIAAMPKTKPELHAAYEQALAKADQMLTYARRSGEYPLTGKGDINLYMLFAELARRIVAPDGIVGLLVPSGIATDDTTKDFFNALMDAKSLASLFDFENRLKVFEDVDGRFKFSALVFGGTRRRTEQADFVFFAHTIEEVAPQNKSRHIALTAADMALLNPNTKTCPIFRTRRDAEITKTIYKRIPILIDENRKSGGNPWGIKFLRMFDQTNDAEHFVEPAKLKKDGFKLRGNRFVLPSPFGRGGGGEGGRAAKVGRTLTPNPSPKGRGGQVFLPLYEAKMVQAFDHRAASVVIEDNNWFRQGQKAETSLVEHQNPEFMVIPRWWIDESAVIDRLPKPVPPALLAFKNVTSPTNTRSMIAGFLPTVAVGNSAPMMLFPENVNMRASCCVLANLNSFVLDYVARQKIGNVNLNFFLIEQFPMLRPDHYEGKCPWSKRETLEHWISERVLKLTCTAEDMKPLAEACEFKGSRGDGVHIWKDTERAELVAELDAAFFHLYGIDRDDAEYILSTFQGVSEPDEALPGHESRANRILNTYDWLAAHGA